MDDDRDALLLNAILDCDNGQIVNMIQAAAELPGTLFDRMSKAYHEIMGDDADDRPIGLR